MRYARALALTELDETPEHSAGESGRLSPIITTGGKASRLRPTRGGQSELAGNQTASRHVLRREGRGQEVKVGRDGRFLGGGRLVMTQAQALALTELDGTREHSAGKSG